MGIRTPDLLNAIEALYQLSYDPETRRQIEHANRFLATPKAMSSCHLRRDDLQDPRRPTGKIFIYDTLKARFCA